MHISKSATHPKGVVGREALFCKKYCFVSKNGIFQFPKIRGRKMDLLSKRGVDQSSCVPPFKLITCPVRRKTNGSEITDQPVIPIR